MKEEVNEILDLEDTYEYSQEEVQAILNAERDKIICQSCGMTLYDEYRGSNIDGSLSDDYCGYCYQNGNFVEEMTIEQAIQKCIDSVDNSTITKEEVYRFAVANFPKLKRWQQ